MIQDERKLRKIIRLIDESLLFIKKSEQKEIQQLNLVHPKYKSSALNLVHYSALRSKNLSKLQKLSSEMGLSSLSRAESHILPSLTTNKQLCQMLLGESEGYQAPEIPIKKSKRQLNQNSKSLLGKRPKTRRTRIMVTMSAAMADQKEVLKEMLLSGMNIARINCAHDHPEIWKRIIENIKSSCQETNTKCLVSMDLGGPKIRTGKIEKGPEILKIKPTKNEKGRVIQGISVWLGKNDPGTHTPSLPITADIRVKIGDILFFKDARHKKRSLMISEVQEEGYIGVFTKTAYIETGMMLFADNKMKDKVGTIGSLPALSGSIYLEKGDLLLLTSLDITAKHYDPSQNSNQDTPIISCTNSEIVHQLKEGEIVLFDDGKFEGVINEKLPESVMIKITKVKGKGAKLRSEKGINFPQSEINLKGLTSKDISDLKFVLKHADIINMSFVNNSDDVTLLLEAIKTESSGKSPGLVFKIETKNGFKNLTNILLTGMRSYPIGVMIARGDLALDVGWKKLPAIQREIMKICISGDIPDIWATQVFETLANEGIPSRAELTDIWVAQRAECVMLNKGPYILEALKMLDDILVTMDQYHDQNISMLPSIYDVIKE